MSHYKCLSCVLITQQYGGLLACSGPCPTVCCGYGGYVAWCGVSVVAALAVELAAAAASARRRRAAAAASSPARRSTCLAGVRWLPASPPAGGARCIEITVSPPLSKSFVSYSDTRVCCDSEPVGARAFELVYTRAHEYTSAYARAHARALHPHAPRRCKASLCQTRWLN